MKTIESVFQMCRVYEDGDAKSGYLNIVIFCTMHSELAFRQVSASDLLDTVSPHQRKRVLQEFHTHELNITAIDSALPVLRDGRSNLGAFEKGQRTSVRKHWTVMRDILSPEAWAMY